MKVLMLDTVFTVLKEKARKTLYGVRSKGASVITSVEPGQGLIKIGEFFQSSNDFIANGSGETLSMFINEDESIGVLSEDDVDIEVIPYATDFDKRIKGVVDTSTLKDCVVAVIGLGSGGGSIVLQLVRSGVTNLILVDFDTVAVSNLCRSVYDLTDIGKKKTDALLEKIMQINPNANIRLVDENILDMSDETLDEIIEKSDLIVEGTDNGKSKIEINGLARHTTPVLYPSVFEDGKGGDILITAPGLPCFECVFDTSENDGDDDNLQGWDYTTGEPHPLVALIADIQVVVARTVKLALAILTSGDKNSFYDKVTEKGCTLLLIGNEKDFYIFDRPFQEVWAETNISKTCSCQTLG